MEVCFFKDRTCNICKKEGHLTRVCKDKKEHINNDNDEDKGNDEVVDFVGLTELIEGEWLADTGTSVYITDNKNDLENITQCNHIVKVGGGKRFKAEESGDVRLKIGSKIAKFKNVLYLPRF